MKLVTYTPVESTNNEAIITLLKSQKTFAKLNDNTWLIGGDLTYRQLRDMIAVFKPKALIVIPFTYDNWATYDCATDIRNFLETYTSY